MRISEKANARAAEPFFSRRACCACRRPWHKPATELLLRDAAGRGSVLEPLAVCSPCDRASHPGVATLRKECGAHPSARREVLR